MVNPCISKIEIFWPVSLIEMNSATLYFGSFFSLIQVKHAFLVNIKQFVNQCLSCLEFSWEIDVNWFFVIMKSYVRVKFKERKK